MRLRKGEHAAAQRGACGYTRGSMRLRKGKHAATRDTSGGEHAATYHARQITRICYRASRVPYLSSRTCPADNPYTHARMCAHTHTHARTRSHTLCYEKYFMDWLRRLGRRGRACIGGHLSLSLRRGCGGSGRRGRACIGGHLSLLLRRGCGGWGGAGEPA